MNNIDEVLLLGPGPSPIHPRVMQALSCPVRGIFDPDVKRAMLEISNGLRKLFGTSNELVFALPASGMSGMEAGIANLVEPGDRVVVCCNGFFSERIAHIAERYGATVTRVSSQWGVPFSTEAIEAALREGKSPKLLAVVLAETSTGGRNALEHLGKLAHGCGALLMVDAVTAIGGMPVEVDQNEVDYCYAASQKCIGSPPGLAPVAISPRAFQIIEKRSTPCPSFYMDFRLVADFWLHNGRYHQTPSSPLIFALLEALDVVFEEGVERRFARHAQVGSYLRAQLERLGLQTSPDPAHALPMLTPVRMPEGLDPKTVIGRLRKEYRIEVGAALGDMAPRFIRIGTMGYGASEDNVDRVVGALKEVLV